MEGQEKTVRGIKTFLKTLVTVVLFIIYMFPFYMIVLNAFKHKRDIIKMPLSWGGKRGFTTDNFVDAFQQMNFMNILKNSLIITCVSVLKPTTATLVILYALSLWNDYLLPSLILTDKSLYTIPIATKLFQGTYSNDMDLLMAALVMAIIPVIILYIALQKYIIAGVVAGAVKS